MVAMNYDNRKKYVLGVYFILYWENEEHAVKQLEKFISTIENSVTVQGLGNSKMSTVQHPEKTALCLS
jgi:hypothetical protein